MGSYREDPAVWRWPPAACSWEKQAEVLWTCCQQLGGGVQPEKPSNGPAQGTYRPTYPGTHPPRKCRGTRSAGMPFSARTSFPVCAFRLSFNFFLLIPPLPWKLHGQTRNPRPKRARCQKGVWFPGMLFIGLASTHPVGGFGSNYQH